MSLLNKLLSVFQSKSPSDVLARYYPSIKPVFLTGTCEGDTAVTGRGCLMNVISYMQGDRVINDRPSSVNMIMQGFGQVLNDFTRDDKDRQKLVKYIPRFMLTGLWTAQETQTAARELYNFLDGLRKEYVGEGDYRNVLHSTCSMYHYVALGETSFRDMDFPSSVYMSFFETFCTVLPYTIMVELEATLDRVLPQLEPGLVEGVVQRHRTANEASFV